MRSFWIHDFASWSDNYRTEAVAAIQNKIRPFLTNTNMRAIVSQPERSLDLRQIMDDGNKLQNFTTGSSASVLSEARKFRLSLIVAHQYLAQINDATADAVWGSVGSIVAFQVGSDDAEMIAQQLGKYPGQITPENLPGLPKYAAYARLLIDGIPSNPFSLQTLPPRRESCDPERAEIIRRIGRRRFPQGNQAQL